ncbi:tetratricopeptide repeat protein [Prevotella sp. DNF00663]|uniref:tetratricopeptide repeat protein n=1 Tax=unclassified Prevotella TaxID=2638335 RepID=UPI000514262E|nr:MULTISPECIES: tetratricopeptide repeat protein [unclassified Prevotella]KGI60252.1 hypothetical protein HMPREF0671_06995 [Prevotella sp. S7 MS 2]KXB84597.1 tetratricopeptide repeat protein [Prevotella sp. DNF00663]
MADNYFNSNEFKDLLHKYEESLQQGKYPYLESEELTDIAEYYHSKGCTEQAIEVIDYAIQLFPGATAPLLFKARFALLREGNIEKAKKYVAQVQDKSDLDYFYIEAEILLVQDKIEVADKYLRQCLNNIAEEDIEDFYIDVASLFSDYDIVDKAQEWLELASDNTSEEYKELQGRIAMGNGQYEECERIFNELIDGNPYASPYWNQLASSQLMRNDFKNSISSSEFSIAINPNDDEAILNKGNGLFALGNYEEALKYYQRFSKLCPHEELGEMLQGITLFNMDRTTEAIAHLIKASEQAPHLSPNLSEIYQELAFALSRQGNTDKALGYVDRAELLPHSSKDELEVLRGHLVLEHGNIDDAQKYFQRAIKLSNSSPQIFLRIAISVFDNGYIQLAYKMFKALLQAVDNKWTTGWAYLAYCCKYMGQTEEYRAAIEKACKVNPYEAQMILGQDFPEDLEPEQYIDYINNNPN